MSHKNLKVLDVVVVGTGIAGLNFIDKYLEKRSKINVVSPSSSENLNLHTDQTKILPSQMRGEHNKVSNYFNANNLRIFSNCKAIGSLNFGGLTNYWGLQIDSYIENNQINLRKKTFIDIKNNLVTFLKKYNLIGTFKHKKKKLNKKDFVIPRQFEDLENNKEFICTKPILAFMTSKNFSGDLKKLNEEKQKLNAQNFFKKITKRKKIIFHDYYVKNIFKKKNFIELICKKNNKEKKFLVKKLVLATGTIATTKIIMDFLKIRKEVKIKHHPRLLSVFFSKKKLNYNLSFTPSLFQLRSKSSKDNFTADLRPGNKLITDSIIDAFPFMRLFKMVINLIRKRLIFSNFLYDSNLSNLYIKKVDDKFHLYSKNKKIDQTLRKKNKIIFNFLKKKGIIFPIYKTFFPGYAADYHYFGSIPFQKSGKLALNNNCQLLAAKNIYIIDGSAFNFRTNKYPLGIVAANARRVARYLSR